MAGEELIQVEKHLEDCTECKAHLEKLHSANNLLHKLHHINPPADFLNTVHKVAHQRVVDTDKSNILDIRPKDIRLFTKTAASIAIALGMLAGGLMGHTVYRHHLDDLDIESYEELLFSDRYLPDYTSFEMLDSYLAILDNGD